MFEMKSGQTGAIRSSWKSGHDIGIWQRCVEFLRHLRMDRFGAMNNRRHRCQLLIARQNLKL
jgi:hypothetical protein